MKRHSLFKVILIVFGALVLINGGLAIAGQFVEKLNVFKMIPIGDTLINFTQSFYYFFDTAVYLLVLGSITAVALLGVKGIYGWILFLCAFAVNVVGIVFTAIDVDKYSKLSVFCHLLSGWCVLFFVRPLIANASVNAFYLILAGGISYSLGAILYWLGKKVKYMHSIFHVFVLAGSVLQWLAIYLYMI